MKSAPEFPLVLNLTSHDSSDGSNEDNMPDSEEAAYQAEKMADRHYWISIAAYFKAQARGFAPGLELDDWLAAEKDYAEMLVMSYLSIVEEDGSMTIVGLRHLAEAIGVSNSKDLNLRADLIRAIQVASRARPCFQIDFDTICNETTDCQWKAECQKMIAVWKR